MRRVLPAIVLVFFAPLIAEVLPGSTPVTQPGLLLFVLLIYGPGALLIRELAVRSGRGWQCILLLGAAYGLIEEGLALQSLFNPSLYHASEWGCRFSGINGVYAEASISIHAVWSAAIPILAADLLFPRLKSVPYLGKVGLVVTGAWYSLGVVLLALITRFEIAPGYSAPPLLLAFCLLLAAGLAWSALRFPSKDAHHEPATRRAPRFSTVLGCIFISSIVWHILLAVLWRKLPVFAQSPWVIVPMAAAASIFAFVLWLVRRWAASRGWSDRHRLAIVCSAIASHAIIGFVIFGGGAIDRVFIVTFGITILSILVSRAYTRDK